MSQLLLSRTGPIRLKCILSVGLAAFFSTSAAFAMPRRMPADDPPGGGGPSPFDCRIGSLPGDFDVDGFGQANYTIPLDVPPGTNGIEPKISLRYGSFNPNGVLGVGWKIEGTSVIMRCAASPAEDGALGGVYNQNTDRFCMDGAKLVAVAGSYGADSTEYKTNPDRVMQIHSYGYAGSPSDGYGPKYFVVKTKDGMTLEYGGNDGYAEGRIEESISPVVRVWALSRVTDRFGNFMDFRYGEDQPTGEYWLDEIWYTGHCSSAPPPTPGPTPAPHGVKPPPFHFEDGSPSSAGAMRVNKVNSIALSPILEPAVIEPLPALLPPECSDPYNHVKFVYDVGARGDSLKLFAAGASTNIARRLNRIETYAFGDSNPVSTYKLTYETSQATYVSRLTSVERCGAGNICLPKTTITWSDPLNGSLKASAITNLTTGLHGFKTFTGWWASSQPYANAASPIMAALQIATGGMYPTISPQFSRGTDGRVSTTFNISYFGINYPFGYGTYTISRSLFGDFNGDGRTDVTDILDGGTAYTMVSTYNGTQWEFSPQSQWGSGLGVREEVKTGDFNGDGKVDLIQVASDGNSYVNLSTGDSFSPPGSFVAYGTGEYKNIFVVDLNGDGKSDLLWVQEPGNPQGGPLSAWISTGTGFSAKTFWGQFAAVHSDKMTLADVDGDGRPDLIHYYDDPPQGTDPTIFVYRGTDTGFVSDGDPGINVLSLNLTGHAVIQSGDFNGDGKADLVIFDRDPTFWDPSYYLNYAYFWLSIGDKEFGRPKLSRAAYLDYTLTNDGAITRDGGVAPTWNFRTRIADFNGDGRADILNLTKNGNPSIRYSRGDSWNVVQDYISHDFGTTLDDVQVGDFDGDGRPDVKDISGTYANTWLNTARPINDKVASITNGYKKRIDIAHMPLTQVSSCVDDPAPTSDPLERAFNSPISVVSGYAISDGLGGMYNYEKYYSCPRYSYNYGFLGYGSVGTRDVPRDIYNVSLYNQSFPLTGMIKEEYRWVSSDILHATIKDRTSTYYWQATNVPVAGSSYNRINMQSETHSQVELDNVGVENTTIEYDRDIYQNLLQKLTLKDLTYEREDSTFYNDPASWTLGLATHTDYLNIKSDLPDQTKSVSRTFDLNTRAELSSTTSWLAGVTPMSLTEQYTYDSFGHKKTYTQSGTNVPSRTTEDTYDALGQFRVLTTNPLGHTVGTVYEGKFGKLLSETDENNLVTNYLIDVFGRTINETRPDATTTDITYCAAPNAADPLPPTLASFSVKTVITGQPTTQKFYDSLERPILEITKGFDGSAIAVTTGYSPLLNVSSHSAPYYFFTEPAYSTTYLYDVLNRVKQVNYPSGAVASVSYAGGLDLEPNTILQTTPLHGRMMTIDTTVDEHRKIFALDDRGRTLQVQDWSTANPNPGLLGLSSYLFDADGNLHQVEDAAGNITTLEWDNNNNRLSINDPDSGLLTFVNNARGETISQFDALSRSTNYTYDLLGRMTYRVAQDGEEQRDTWNWDTAPYGKGRLQSSSSTNSFFLGESFLSQFNYDALSRLSSVDQTATFPSNQNFLLSASFGYDSAGRLADLTYPGSIPFTVHYGYNANGYVNSVTRPATNETFWTATAQTARNQVSAFTLGNGVQTNLTFDPLFGNLTSISYPQSSIEGDFYSYDALGRLGRRESIQGSYENIFYDTLSRVISTSSGNINQTFPDVNISYDQIGNIVSKSDVGDYEYGGFGPSGPHAVTDITGPPITATFQYNAVGNMTSGRGRTYQWTTGNQVEKIISPDGDTEYRYDPERKKYWRKVSGVLTTTTLFFGRLYERDGDDVVTPLDEKRYIYVNGQPILNYSGTAQGTFQSYMHSDYLGSLGALTTASGSLIEPLSYDIFGLRRQANFDPTGNITPTMARGFTEHDMLDTYQLIDMQARTYDPKIGRFLSPDPMIGSLTNTQSLNRYSYVMNNPTNMTDPTGLTGEGLAKAGASAVGGDIARCAGSNLTVVASGGAVPLIGQTVVELASIAAAQVKKPEPVFDPKLAKIDLKPKSTVAESTNRAKVDPNPLERQEKLRQAAIEKDRRKWEDMVTRDPGKIQSQVEADLERQVRDGISGAQDALDLLHIEQKAKEWGMTVAQAKSYIAGRILWNLFNAAGAGPKGGLYTTRGANGNNW